MSEPWPSISPGITDQVLVPSEHKKPFIVACIPAYNEEWSIGVVAFKARRFVDEVVVCDDGSTDATADIAAALGAWVIRQPRKMGYSAALSSLFSEAKAMSADFVVTLDGDGKHDPGEIPVLLNELERSGSDIVVGSRFLRGGGSGVSGWGRKGFKLISGVASSGSNLSDVGSSFRAYSRRALDSLTLTENGAGLSAEVIVKAAGLGLKVTEVPINVSRRRRKPGPSPLLAEFPVLLNKVESLAMNRPLLFFGVPGVLFTFIATVFSVITLESYITTHNITFSLTVVSLGSAFIGLTLLSIAIIIWVMTGLVKEAIRKP